MNAADGRSPVDRDVGRLQRWGLRFNGTERTVEFMPDGYWTPWHIAQAELDRLRAENEALRAADDWRTGKETIDRLRAERDALRNRLVAEIRKTEPGCFETATASAEAKVNEYLDAFHAAMERHREAPNAVVSGGGTPSA